MEKKQTTGEKAIHQFLSSFRERNVSPHTLKAYSGDLENFSAYVGPRKWREIDHITIRGFLSHLYEKGLGKTSVARSLAAVRSLYRWLAQEGVVEQNPAALVSTPAGEEGKEPATHMGLFGATPRVGPPLKGWPSFPASSSLLSPE